MPKPSKFITLAGMLVSALVLQATEVSVTMDDFNIHESTKLTGADRNKLILETLQRQKIKAALFVVCQNVQDDAGKTLLKAWSEGGHLIGNHTFTHPRYGKKTNFKTFSADVARCDHSLQKVPGFQKLFRFPMLAEGDTVEQRDQMRKWLSRHGYRNGHVTIDASDWYLDQRLREKLKIDPNFNLQKFRDYYLDHIWTQAQFYNDLAKEVLGHEVKHTLLVHFNLLNALFLNDLLEMFKRKGWQLIDAETAFADPVFKLAPKSMPSGQSLIWALAKETGKYDQKLRYPGEDSEYEKVTMDKLGL